MEVHKFELLPSFPLSHYLLTVSRRTGHSIGFMDSFLRVIIYLTLSLSFPCTTVLLTGIAWFAFSLGTQLLCTSTPLDPAALSIFFFQCIAILCYLSFSFLKLRSVISTRLSVQIALRQLDFSQDILAV
jgi:hypothetical protein